MTFIRGGGDGGREWREKGVGVCACVGIIRWRVFLNKVSWWNIWTGVAGWGVDRRLQPMRWLIGAASSSAGRRFGIPHPGVCSYWQRELNNTELKERRKGRLTSSTVPSVWAQPSATDCPFWRGRADLLTKNTRADFFFTAGEKPPSLTERVSGCSNLQNVPQITSVPVPLSVSYSRQLLFWVLPSRLPSSHSSSSSSSVLSSRSLSLFFLYEPRCCYRACTRAFTYTVGWALYSSDAGGWRWETAVNQQRLFSRQDLSNKSSFC